MPPRQSRRRAHIPRQHLEKRLDLFGIKTKLRRKLPQNRPELRAQPQNTRSKEIRQRLAYLCQPQHVREVARALYCKNKIARRGLGPSRKTLWALQRIECAVDFNRPEDSGGVL